MPDVTGSVINKTGCKEREGGIYIDYFMVGERVRFLFTSCGESQTNERVFERVNKNCTREPTMK